MTRDRSFLPTVDEKIRGLIERINDLPFVHSTVFSCAGYGRAGDSPARRHRNTVPTEDAAQHKPIHGRWCGYVAIAYEPALDWATLHKTLGRVSHTSQRPSGFERSASRRLGKPVRSYHVSGPSGSLDELRAGWASVEAVVNSFLQHAETNAPPARRRRKGRVQVDR